ncbi:MAG: glycerophosphodiester phosphodiesterase [Candidatus Limiplasma sp.]|nr:glycerophosphodiester phosphodiesterase [Candidatus Limiplasma sp.]
MTKVFGHRGFSGNYPENTMLAFREAERSGAEGIETDVHLTRDGVPVLIHDERVDRTTNGAGDVRDYTLAELQKLDARWKFGGSVPFQTIPTLEEYLDFMLGNRLLTNIELKTSVYEYPGLEEKVVEMVGRFGLTDRVWYSSFNHFSVLRAKALCPQAKCGLLLDCWLVGAGEYGKRLGMQTINGCTPYFKPEVVEEIHASGLEALAWTPNEPEDLRRLAAAGADVLITNYPDRGLEAVRGG